MSAFQVPAGVNTQLPGFPADPITSFTGPYRWLNNFHEAEIDIGAIMERFLPDYDDMEGRLVATNEHGFQLLKSLDRATRALVRNAPTPGAAKKLGGPHGIVTLRPDWEEIKIQVMEALVLAKFVQHEELRAKLLGTGERELIEGNSHGDDFWGVVAGRGQNQLGKILERVRTHLSP